MTKGAGLRPDAKATEPPPDPTVGAPVLDSTVIRPRFERTATAAHPFRQAMMPRRTELLNGRSPQSFVVYAHPTLLCLASLDNILDSPRQRRSHTIERTDFHPSNERGRANVPEQKHRRGAHRGSDHGVGSAFAGPLEGTSTIVRSSAAPFVEGEHSVKTCVAYGKKSGTGMDLGCPALRRTPLVTGWTRS